jgi:geranylgeranyl diphosphate synthase, type I
MTTAVLPDPGIGVDDGVGHDGLDLAGIAGRADASLEAFLADKARDGELGWFAELLRECLRAGGKRIRPVLCVLGWQAAGGGGDAALVYRWAASLELFHLFALIHDDIMDDSATRRGRPTVHQTMAACHPYGVRGPAADRFGRNSAILIGDLALVWAEEMLHARAADDQTAAAEAGARPLVDEMRAEVMAGQYLDLAATGRVSCEVAEVLRIARLKTAKYTVERPLQIGAALGGADRWLLRHCSAFAIPLGEAFQLRDDLLGVFGDPRRSGKPVLDDLREGKATIVLAVADQRATAGQRDILQDLVGRPDLDADGAARIRQILTALQVPQAVEDLIAARYRRALRALDEAPFAPAAAASLRAIAESIVSRSA